MGLHVFSFVKNISNSAGTINVNNSQIPTKNGHLIDALLANLRYPEKLEKAGWHTHTHMRYTPISKTI